MRLLLAVTFCRLISTTRPAFRKLATYNGVGGAADAMVGPGPTLGSQRLYVDYTYDNNTLDVVAINPDTGEFQVYGNPTKSEWAPKTMTVGPDGNIYVPTVPQGRILRLNPTDGTFVDVGRPSTTETYIWQLAVAPDQRIYGCTYPSAKLVRYDPATGALEDLGRMDPVENYTRYVAASSDGFIYAGIGYSKSHLAAYEISTGAYRDILPVQYQVIGVTHVWKVGDVNIYAVAAGQNFRLHGWIADPIVQAVPEAPRNRFADGRLMDVLERKVRVTAPDGAITDFTYGYQGHDIPVSALGLGPDDMLYGSSVLPAHFFKVDPSTGALNDIGLIGDGEVYSFLTYKERLLIAAYAGLAPLISYDPSRPFQPGTAQDSNPLLVHFAGEDNGWRPKSMAAGPQGKIYIGATAGYGKLNGPMTAWDTATNKVEQFELYPDQSVESVTIVDNLVVGGTNIEGGGGSQPTATEARLFAWDTLTKTVVFDGPAVPGAASITDLVTGPNGLVYGIGGNSLFVFDPTALRVIYRSLLPFSGQPYSSMGVGPDGKLWGLAIAGIFSVSPDTNEVALVAQSPEQVTAGFGMDTKALYFAAGPNIYRYSFQCCRIDGAAKGLWHSLKCKKKGLSLPKTPSP